MSKNLGTIIMDHLRDRDRRVAWLAGRVPSCTAATIYGATTGTDSSVSVRVAIADALGLVDDDTVTGLRARRELVEAPAGPDVGGDQ